MLVAGVGDALNGDYYDGNGKLQIYWADYLVLRYPDPRCPWISIAGLGDAQYPHWAVVNFQFFDANESGGDVNVYVFVDDENGLPVKGMTVVQMNGGVTDLFTRSDAGHIGEVDFPQTGDSSFDPGKNQVGPYSVILRDKNTGIASEKVIGMGLPLRRHVSYRIRFQKQLRPGPNPPPPEPPPPEPPPTEWREAYKDEHSWLRVK